jgi:hypothetical protein
MRTATPVYLGIYLALLSATGSFPLPSRAEKHLALSPAVWAVLLLLSGVGTYFGYREISGWHHSFLAKAIGEKVFQPGGDNRFSTTEMKLLLARHTDEGMRLEPYAPSLLSTHIITYTNLSLATDQQQLADEYRKKALEAAKRHLAMFPYDSRIHMIVGTRLQVPDEMAIEHIGKAIALDPANLQLYEDLKNIALPAKQFDKALTYYEYYIPRFFNQKMNQDYARIGMQAQQAERVINTLARIDLSRKFTPGSAEYSAAKKTLAKLIEDLHNVP